MGTVVISEPEISIQGATGRTKQQLLSPKFGHLPPPPRQPESRNMRRLGDPAKLLSVTLLGFPPTSKERNRSCCPDCHIAFTNLPSSLNPSRPLSLCAYCSQSLRGPSLLHLAQSCSHFKTWLLQASSLSPLTVRKQGHLLGVSSAGYISRTLQAHPTA